MAFFPVDANTMHNWPFDEASGNTNADLVPGGTPMVLLDAAVPPIRQATFGNGRLIVSWNSASMCAPLTQAEVDYFRNSANPYTIEIVASSNDPGFASSLFGIDNRRVGGAGSHLYLQYLMQNNGNKNYLIQGNAAPVGGFGSGNNAFPVDDPNCTLIHALVREVSGGQHRGLLYLNGQLVHTTGWLANYVAADDGEPSFPYRYFIGRGIGGQWCFGGVIDEVCISNVARSGAELALRAVGGGSAAPSGLPVASNLVPALNAPLSLGGAVQFDIDEDDVERVALSVSFTGRDDHELIYTDELGFTPRYEKSTKTAISGAVRFTVRRNGGWPAPPRFHGVTTP